MEKLTKEKAAQQVERIEKMKGDAEAAHSTEDGLIKWFISCIAEGHYKTLKEVVEVATEVEKSQHISFARWCA